jgi:hypothetical protein
MKLNEEPGIWTNWPMLSLQMSEPFDAIAQWLFTIFQ